MCENYLRLLVALAVCIFCIAGIDGGKISKPETGKGSEEDYQDDDDEKGGVSLGRFESYAHDLAGEVTLLDDKTMEISGLNYDGLGPAAWFMLGEYSGSRIPERIELNGIVIPDENENCETLKRYSADDIKLKLPGKMKFTDFNYISMYCVRFNHNFGYVMIPDDIKLKNGTAPATLKECDQDDLDDADDNRVGQPARPRQPIGPPPRPSGGGGGGGLLSGILDTVFG